jgi:hypothetical protein
MEAGIASLVSTPKPIALVGLGVCQMVPTRLWRAQTSASSVEPLPLLFMAAGCEEQAWPRFDILQGKSALQAPAEHRWRDEIVKC